MINGNCKWILKDGAEDTIDKDPIHIIDHILEQRGIIKESEKEFFLSPKLENMHNPMDLQDMDIAVDRIIKAKQKEEQITIYGDYDVDGITSTSILYLFLKENNYNIDYYIPDRTAEGYGLNKDAIRQIKENGTSLVITVDTGISAIEEVDFANELGLDIIITDHHECKIELPEAIAVINPKRLDSKYPFKELAGVGVTFKLIHALALTMNVIDEIWKYIDIVAVGTIADIVPLVDENRIIVRNAFETISNTWNVGLSSLIDITGNSKKKITAGTIGFQIAPRINAAGRLGDAKKAVELFTTNNKEKAMIIAKELDDENKERQKIEQEIFEIAVEKIESSPNIKNSKVLVVAGDNWHSGVIGIVSSRITEKYYKPSIVLSIDDDIASGSARSIDGFSIYEAISEIEDMTIKFGGHDMAAGITIQTNMIDEFTKSINEYANKVMDKDTLTRKLKIDCIITDKQVNFKMIDYLEKLEPYGIGNPSPIFLYKGVVHNKQTLGKNGEHLKMKIQGDNKLTSTIGFNMGNTAKELLRGDKLDIACNLNKNEWNNNVSIQFIIKDLKLNKQDLLESKFYLNLYNLIPNPSFEELNIFTNTIKTCYINTYGNINSKSEEKFYSMQIRYLVPTRDDIAIIYRYLRDLEMEKNHSISIHTLKRDIKEVYMTEYKILQIMDILLELNLLKYNFKKDNCILEFELIKDNKNPLHNSKKYLNLTNILKFS